MKKGTRRKRGADGKLHTSEELKTELNSGPAKEVSVAEISTPEKTKRDEKSQKSVQEKSTTLEKENAPVIIITYNDVNGKRQTKTYTCDKIMLTKNEQQELMRSGPKTTLDIYIEASVIEVL